MPAAAKYVRRPCERRDLYAAAVVLENAGRRLARNNRGRWLWVPAPVRNCALGRDDGVAAAGISFQE